MYIRKRPKTSVTANVRNFTKVAKMDVKDVRRIKMNKIRP